MSDVPRLKDTKQHDPRIDEWLAAQPGDLGILAREVTNVIRRLAVGGTETLQDGSPVTCIEGAAYVFVSMQSDHVQLGFFQGADLPDPSGLLTGTGELMRYVRLTVKDGVDAAAVIALIQAAYDDMALRAARPVLH